MFLWYSLFSVFPFLCICISLCILSYVYVHYVHYVLLVLLQDIHVITSAALSELMSFRNPPSCCAELFACVLRLLGSTAVTASVTWPDTLQAMHNLLKDDKGTKQILTGKREPSVRVCVCVCACDVMCERLPSLLPSPFSPYNCNCNLQRLYKKSIHAAFVVLM